MNCNFTMNYEGKIVCVACMVDGEIVNVKEILSSPNPPNSVLLSSDDTIPYPYLIPTSKGGNTLDFTQVYNIISKFGFNCSDEVIAQLNVGIGQLTGHPDLFNEKKVRELQDAFIAFRDYMDGDLIRIKMSPSMFDNFMQTKNKVDEINSSGRAEEMYIEGENKTLHMSTPDSEFFIRVPSVDELNIEVPLFPIPEGIYNPYPQQPGLRTPKYKQHLTSNNKIEDVTGYMENNDLPLQPNEQRYYNALVSLLKAATQQEFPERNADECIAQGYGSHKVKAYITNLALLGLSQNWSHTGLVPLNLRYELIDVNERAAYGEYDDGFAKPKQIDDDDMERDLDGTKVENSVASNKSFYGQEVVSVDASVTLVELMSDLMRKDFYKAIEFAIKLNRFGFRKPTRLSLGDNGSYLDLNKFSIVKGSGNYSSTEFVVDENGNNLTPIYSITMQNYMIDKNYIKKYNVTNPSIDLPIGLVCRREYKNTNDYHLVCMSFIDLIKSYQKNEPNCKIKGITYNNEKFTIDSEVIETLSSNTIELRQIVSEITNGNSNMIYHCYSDFVDAFFVKECFDKKTSILSILNTYYNSSDLSVLDLYSYNSIEELDDVITINLIAPQIAISANIAKYVIPLVNRTNYYYESAVFKGKDMSVEDILNTFSQVMDELGFIGIFGEGLPEPKQSMATSSSFNKNNDIEDDLELEEEEELSMKDMLISKNIEGKIHAKVYLPLAQANKLKSRYEGLDIVSTFVGRNVKTKEPEERALVGFLAMDKQTKEVIFVHPSNPEFRNREKYDSSLDAKKFVTALANTVKLLADGKDSLYKYYDKDSCKYYCDLSKELTLMAFEGGL